MPRKPREYLLRYSDQTANHLERAQGKLQQMHDIYEKTHPEHAEFCATTVMLIEMVLNQVKGFKKDFM